MTKRIIDKLEVLKPNLSRLTGFDSIVDDADSLLSKVKVVAVWVVAALVLIGAVVTLAF